jgi:hypothetical protein
LLVLLAGAASAQTSGTCSQTRTVPLERQLRQLYLDLLNRPPTIDEYRAVQARGGITADDIRALMATDEFYLRMRGYHRALFRANIAASVYNANNSALSGTGDAASPFGWRGNNARGLRGGRNLGCNHNIQQSACDAVREDPHAEPTTPKQCYDASGVPLPVSFDYDTASYTCTQLDLADPAITSCTAAVTAGAIPDKHLYYCDMRRDAQNALHPFLCLPNLSAPGQSTLTTEELDSAGRVIAFYDAARPTTRLDRCTLDLALRNGVVGSYMPRPGCIQREGWTTTPATYWEPAGGRTTVVTCAIEAQQRAANPATGESCETARFVNDRSCGCGAGGRRCEAAGGSVHGARVAALNTEPELIADSVLRRDEPYFNILTTRRSFVNGVLSTFYRQQQGVGVFAVSAPADPASIPDIPYTQPAVWREYTRDDQHSGVLTAPAYLYRYATWRARISGFYEAMLCTHFAPPANATLPAPEDACNREPNLAKRCGCNYCHATIEPTGAHWGRFSERGATFLDPLLFPRVDLRCRDCAVNGDVSCGGQCADYVMQAYDGDGANSLGLLKTYLYRTDLEEENIEGGPRLLVQRMLATGELERCTVKRMWKEFLGRPMTQQEMDLYLDELVQGFVASNWNLKALIEALLASPAYRRID